MMLYNTNPLHNFYPSNNLAVSFNVNKINKAITEKAFIEENPISTKRLPLTICIVVESTFEIFNTLNSIKNINCEKFIFLNEIIDNKNEAEKDLGIKIVDTYKTISNEIIINYTRINYKTSYLLIIKSNEIISYIGILKLQALLENPGDFNSSYVQVVEKDMKNMNYEKRLFKIPLDFHIQNNFYDDKFIATDISILCS